MKNQRERLTKRPLVPTSAYFAMLFYAFFIAFATVLPLFIALDSVYPPALSPRAIRAFTRQKKRVEKVVKRLKEKNYRGNIQRCT